MFRRWREGAGAGGRLLWRLGDGGVGGGCEGEEGDGGVVGFRGLFVGRIVGGVLVVLVTTCAWVGRGFDMVSQCGCCRHLLNRILSVAMAKDGYLFQTGLSAEHGFSIFG